MGENDVSDFTLDLDNVVRGDDGLAIQDFKALDIDKIAADTLQVMSRQATINIGTIGHVAHGKSTVVMAMSGVKTTKFTREAVMNITIHLGYANAKIYRSTAKDAQAPASYRPGGSSQRDLWVDPVTKEEFRLVRHVSFVDCPGHDVLMATMLNGAAIMDAALLLIAANESFPQPQTLEHLKAVEIMKLRNLIVLQNKIDLVKETDALDQYNQIRTYFDRTIGIPCPILPISAQKKFNIDALLEYICHIPLPRRVLRCPVRMVIVRSFDVNKPGAAIESLRGGVAGGSVTQGVLQLNQEIEVRPGLVSNIRGQFSAQPILTTAVMLLAENNALQFAIPGGLIAVGTKIDPCLTRQNKMVGMMIGDRGSLPDVLCEIEIQFFLLSQIVGMKQTTTGSKTASTKIPKLQVGEILQINVGTLTASGTVVEVSKDPDLARLKLASPVCCSPSDQVAISRRIDKNFRLIGWGTIRRGAAIPITSE